MSTKIYTAYKLKSSKDLWPFIHDTRLKATRNLQKRLRDWYLRRILSGDGAVESTSVDYAAYKQNRLQHSEFFARLSEASTILRNGYKAASSSSLNDVCDFDLSIGVRQFEGEIYVIPSHGWGSRGLLSFLSRDPRLVDFHYQNQSDKPSRISNREWSKRGKIWNAMEDTGQWRDVLVLEICTYPMWYLMDPSMYPAPMKYLRRRFLAANTQVASK